MASWGKLCRSSTKRVGVRTAAAPLPLSNLSLFPLFTGACVNPLTQSQQVDEHLGKLTSIRSLLRKV